MNDKVFIVGIELNNKAAFERFEKSNFGMGIPVKIVPGLYCVKTQYSQSSEYLRNSIVGMFSGQCQVFVMKSSIELSWRLPESIAQWLRANI